MLAGQRSQVGSIVGLAVDVSLTVLSDRVHRGSLANARRALDERHESDQAAALSWREVADRVRPAPRMPAVSG